MHELKTRKPFFQHILDKKKNFECRINDRNFKEGDYLILKEFRRKTYTGREVICKVTYVLQGGNYGIDSLYCVMGFIICF